MTILPSIAVADVGSTKADWCFIQEKGGVVKFTGPGYNPTTISHPPHDFISPEVEQRLHQVHCLYYYGAGVGQNAGREKVMGVFRKYENLKLEVASDLLGAARAALGQNEGYLVILGTGSSAAYYDGLNVRPVKPALGYVLGDHGSANYMGKLLLQRYFLGQMPSPEVEWFESDFDVQLESVLQGVYGHAPAAYLGTFARFLSNHRSTWTTQFVRKIFEEFVILYFNDQKIDTSLPIYFVGSTALAFEDELRQVFSAHGMQPAEVIKSPISKLTEFHRI